MKHGRRHKTLKEQAYLARKDALGYGTPYPPIDVAEPTGEFVAEAPPAEVPLALAANKKALRQLRRLGIDPLDGPDEA